MDVKITPGYWRHSAVEKSENALSKLCGLWLLTNDSLNYVGYAEVTRSRFVFETSSPPEALNKAFTDFGDTFVKFGDGYWVRNFIERQFGRGDSLIRNNYCKPILRDLMRCPAKVIEAVLMEYPELRSLYENGLSNKPSPRASEALAKGSPSPREERRREEKRRTEQRGEAKPRGSRGKPAGGKLTKLGAEPYADLGRKIGAMLRRRDSATWSAAEIAALAELHRVGVDAADLADLATYYSASIPAIQDRRRQDVGTLLAHWAGEVDRARKFAMEKGRAENPEGLKEL